jgi:hypothetical protein
MNLKKYFSNSLNHIKSNVSVVLEDTISLGGKTAKLTTFSKDLKDLFFPSLAHLKVLSDEFIDLQLYYVSDDCLDIPFSAPNWGNIEFDAQGYASELDQKEIGVFFQPWLRQIFMYSYAENIGIYWVKSLSEIPWWEATFSFRTIFHMWTRNTPLQLMHAGAIATENGNAYLFPAKSGSGKSTTTCMLSEAGYVYLGDDYVLIDTDKNIVYKLYGTTKMEWDNLESRFSHLLPRAINLNQRPNQKGILYLESNKQFKNFASICAIIVPEVNNENSGIIKASIAHSLFASAPTTLHHLPHNRSESYTKIRKLSSNLPNFIWKLNADKKILLHQFQEFYNETAT